MSKDMITVFPSVIQHVCWCNSCMKPLRWKSSPFSMMGPPNLQALRQSVTPKKKIGNLETFHEAAASLQVPSYICLVGDILQEGNAFTGTAGNWLLETTLCMVGLSDCNCAAVSGGERQLKVVSVSRRQLHATSVLLHREGVAGV